MYIQSVIVTLKINQILDIKHQCQNNWFDTSRVESSWNHNQFYLDSGAMQDFKTCFQNDDEAKKSLDKSCRRT